MKGFVLLLYILVFMEYRGAGQNFNLLTGIFENQISQAAIFIKLISIPFFFSPKDWLGATKITNVPFGTPLTRHVSVCVNVTKGDSVAADCPGSESVPLLVCILSAEEKHKKITHKPINNLCYVLGTLLCSCLHIFPSLLLNESMVKKKLQMSHMKLNQVPSHPSLIAWCKI